MRALVHQQGLVINPQELLRVSVALQLIEAKEDILDIQDLNVDSDSDEVVNYEVSSSESDGSIDDEDV